MPLMIWNGKLLTRGGKLAVDPACCCTPTPTPTPSVSPTLTPSEGTPTPTPSLSATTTPTITPTLSASPTTTPTLTATPTLTPSSLVPICRHIWVCRYDCQGDPPDWGSVSRVDWDCVLIPDDCFESVWTYDEGSSTERYKQYTKTTCSETCAVKDDCFDPVPTPPDEPDFTPPYCVTPTPTPSTPVPTPTPSTPVPTPTTSTPAPTPTTSTYIDPTKYYCMHYGVYSEAGCTGSPFSSGTACVYASFYQVCWEPFPGVYVKYDTIVSGPYDAPGCDGNC